MLETLGIVQAHLGSQRFRCMASRKLGGRSLLEWVVRRVTDCTRLDGVIMLACGSGDDDLLNDLVPSDVPIFVDDGSDPLDRFTHALERYPAEAAVRVQGDNPFVDPALIDRLVTSAEWHGDCDYAGYCSQDGRPATLSPVGVFAEWFRSSALRRAARSARRHDDRNEITRYLYTHPEKFRLRLIPAPEEIDRDDVRLTIDEEEDWDHALEIYEALGPEALDWQMIADLLDHQPALRRRMAALNRVHSGV